MSTNDIDPTALNDWSRPLARSKVELYCLGRTLMPDDATIARTLATVMFIGVWAAMVLAPLFGAADRPRWELTIAVTAIVFTILGRMWDFEVQRVLDGIPLPDGGRRNDRREE